MACKVTVEVPLFLTFFAFLLTDSVNTNLMIYRTCYVILGFDKHNCSLLGKTDSKVTTDLEKLVQPKADVIAMVKVMVDSISAAVLCLFVGAWSDRFGRKPVLVASIAGYTLMNVIMVVFVNIEGASPWYMMVCSVPVIMTGGGAALLTVLSAYLTDVTSEEERGFRMGVFEVTMAIAVLAGSASSSYIFNATSYIAIYAIATATCFLALVYTWKFLPESLEMRERTGRFKGLFQTRNISGMFRTSFRNRPGNDRAVILLVMLALALMFVVYAGDGSVMFLYVREKFQWTLKQYTWFSSAGTIMWITGTFFIVYIIHYRMHVKESHLIFAGFTSVTVGMLVQGFAQVGWLLYVAAVIKLPSAIINPMTRSLLSKSVGTDEIGRIFAIFGFIQNVLGLVGSPVYTTLYNATLDTDPGAFNFLTAAVNLINTVCLFTVLKLEERRDGYMTLSDDGEENQENRTDDDLVVNS